MFVCCVCPSMVENSCLDHSYWILLDVVIKLHRWYISSRLCRKQESRLSCLSSLPLVKICVRAITPESYEVQSWNIIDGLLSHEANVSWTGITTLVSFSFLFFFFFFFFFFLLFKLCVRAINPEPCEIQSGNIVDGCSLSSRCVVIKNIPSRFVSFFSYLLLVKIRIPAIIHEPYEI